MMIYFDINIAHSRISRRAALVFLGLWLGAVQSSALGSVCLPASQADDGGNPKAQLADKEVLKLQAEKRDSIDRLERTAAEIARKWRARQAQNDALQNSKSKMTSPAKGEPSGSGSMVDANANPSTYQSLPSPSEQNSLDSSSGTESPSANIPSVEDSETAPSMNPLDVGMKAGAKPEMQSHSSIQVASVSSVVDGQIDRLALATSLYATDQYRECLKTLEAVELRPLSVEDRQWHDYLAASSYRKLGDRSEAEGNYRSVLQRSTSTWVSAAARWWLGHMDEITQFELKIQQVQTSIGNWRKEIDALKSAN